MTAGYTWSYGVISNGSQRRIRIAALANDPPVLQGDGSLFWLTVHVLGNNGATSPLDLREFINGVGGSTIYSPDDPSTPIPLDLQDGIFHVAPFNVLGDLNGNGAVEAIDAYLALQIASNKLVPTPEQLAAGDINGNGQVDAGDATMILYHAAHGVWPAIEAAERTVVPASTMDEVRLSLDAVTGAPGSTVAVTLRAENLVGWAGGTLAIAYDPTMVQFAGVAATGMAQGFGLAHHNDASGLLRIALANGLPRNGSGALLQITFKIAPSAGENSQTALALAQAKLNNGLGQDFATSGLGRTILRGNGLIRISSQDQQHRLYLPTVLSQ